MAIPSDYWWIPLLRAHPLDYVSIGLGIVFIATSLYLVRACFRIVGRGAPRLKSGDESVLYGIQYTFTPHGYSLCWSSAN